MTDPELVSAPTRTEPVLDSTTRADQSAELATTALLRAAIGPVSTNYYLPLFTRFDAQDRAGLSWNTAAALTTLNWMMFRRMWNAALAYAGIALTLALLVFGIGKLAFHYSPELQWALAGLYALLLVGLPGLLGNALLFKHYRSNMARALADSHSLAEATAMLAAQAPQRQRMLVLAVLNAVAAAALAALAVWASGFNGMPAALGLPAVAEPPVTPASGNVAVGRALEAASAPAATASAPITAASVPAAPASAASAPAVTASSPVVTASAPALAASATKAPTAAASASAPAATASAPAQIKRPLIELPPGLPEKKTEPPAAKTGSPDKSPSPAPAKAPAAPDTAAKEKAEAARLAPQAAAQNAERKPAKPAPAAAARSEAKEASAPARSRAAEKKTTAKPKPAAPVAEPAAAMDKPGGPVGSFGINVGVFADDNNARNAFVKLSDAGLPAYTQELKGKKGKLTRVRVGPYTSVAEAERTAERIRGLGLDALVFQQNEGR